MGRYPEYVEAWKHVDPPDPGEYTGFYTVWCFDSIFVPFNLHGNDRLPCPVI